MAMLDNLSGEDPQAALDEMRGTVGVLASAPAFHQLEPPRQLPLGHAVHVTPDEALHGAGDGGESVDAGTALAGSLVREPSGDARAFDQATRGRREHSHDAGPDPSVDRA
jgi:hypothetical protein